MVAHRRLAVFQGTFRDSWAAAKMAEFMAVRQEAPVPRPARGQGLGDRDGVPWRGRDRPPRAGTQAFLRLLRWAEANGRVERIEA